MLLRAEGDSLKARQGSRREHVASFRLFRLNELNEIIERQDFDAADDLAAVRVANRACVGSAWELWELGRRVASRPVEFAQAA